jgi:carbamoyltransferase
MGEHWIDYDLGFPYMLIGHYLKDINFEALSEGNLVYSGKIMGLVSYGKVREEWLDAFMDYYKSDPQGDTYQEKIKVLSERINVPFDTNKRLEGQLAYDIATTSQRAFEECFLEIAKPYFELFPDLPICITGGCGLNILLNTRLVNEFNRELFVGPNPNDCGLAVGLVASIAKPKEPFDVTYAGLPILDKNMFQYYFVNSSWWKDDLDINDVVEDLAEGKIIGVVRDRSEHGPRALGNRSIICNPSFPEMKDILNKKVKNREWYRPFAPVVRLEDVNKYFEWDKDARWMSYAPIVREEWREKLAAITHVDNTARVQTVTREQNEWLYDLITAFEAKTGIGVLLNTSFNVNRMPILTTLKEALHVFEHTQMDTLIIEDNYIRKYMKL